MMPDSSDSPLWLFCLALYARPEVAESCLNLQDRCHADVGIILYLLWLASLKRRLNDTAIERITSTTQDWRERVIKPLRALRRGLKNSQSMPTQTAAERLRQPLKKLELHAEKLHLQRLFESTQPSLPGDHSDDIIEACRANLEIYNQTLGNRFNVADIDTLIHAMNLETGAPKQTNGRS